MLHPDDKKRFNIYDCDNYIREHLKIVENNESDIL